MKEDRKPFFPKNKPKSWVCAVSAALVGLLCAGPVLFIGLYFDITIIYNLGVVFFYTCWAVAFYFGLFLTINQFSGKYNNLEEKSWKEQKW